LLAFVLSVLLLLFEAGSVAARLIHYGGIYIACGCAIPWGYTLLAERNTPAAMGVKRERWVVSLVLNVILAGLLLPILLFEGDLSAFRPQSLSRAIVVLAGAGGLFELFLYYGFVHLRLEKAFNIGSVEQASAAFPWR